MFDYAGYWDKRYAAGGTSGDGSYGESARAKAEVVNRFVLENNPDSVIEYGCGDGNQLALIEYPEYLGLDVSAEAVRLCQKRFHDDPTKTFAVYNPRAIERPPPADMAICLDVLYHITDDDDYFVTLSDILRSAQHSALLFTTHSTSNWPGESAHAKHRDLTAALRMFKDWAWRMESVRREKQFEVVWVKMKKC